MYTQTSEQANARHARTRTYARTHHERKSEDIPLVIFFGGLLSGVVVFILAAATGDDGEVKADEEEDEGEVEAAGNDALGFFGSGRSSVMAQPPPPAPVSLQ